MDLERSRDYGSPNYRCRAYGIGSRIDVCDYAQFNMSIHIFFDVFPGVHNRCSLFDCWAYLVRGRYSQTVPKPSKESSAIDKRGKGRRNGGGMGDYGRNAGKDAGRYVLEWREGGREGSDIGREGYIVI